jgi:hypothetical protein
MGNRDARPSVSISHRRKKEPDATVYDELISDAPSGFKRTAL